MEVRRVTLSETAKDALQASLDTSAWEWPVIEQCLADLTAAVWRIGDDAWAITVANADDEIDIIAGGGRGANKATRPFLEAMERYPAHRGFTLRLEGRRGWMRFCKGWEVEEAGGGDVIMTKRV